MEAIASLAEASRDARRRGEFAGRLEGYVKAHPELRTLIPALLDRGDPAGRQLAFLLADLAKGPEMLAALRDFALSQRGPDSLRHQALQTASQAGLLPSGPIRMWIKGAWTEILVLGWEITREAMAYYNHPPQVQDWLEQSLDATRQGRLPEAER